VSGQQVFFPVYRFDDFAVDGQLAWQHCSFPTMPSVSAVATQVAARTNPSRASVAIPNALVELGHVVGKTIVDKLRSSMSQHVLPDRDLYFYFTRNGRRGARVRRKKRRAIKSDTNGNSIAYHEFGVMNLWRDLAGLLDFAEQSTNRLDELNRLYAKGGLKRKRVAFSGHAADIVYNVPYQTVECGVWGNSISSSTARRWCTIRWVPDVPTIPTDLELVRKARLAVHGWDWSAPAIASTVWDAIPWTWLLDYMGNVGDYLHAHRNLIGAHVGRCSVMTRTETYRYQQVTSITTGFTYQGGNMSFVSLERAPGNVPITADFPFLSGRQLSILSGIAANQKGPQYR
jgi:hypothetical protein